MAVGHTVITSAERWLAAISMVVFEIDRPIAIDGRSIDNVDATLWHVFIRSGPLTLVASVLSMVVATHEGLRIAFRFELLLVDVVTMMGCLALAIAVPIRLALRGFAAATVCSLGSRCRCR